MLNREVRFALMNRPRQPGLSDPKSVPGTDITDRLRDVCRRIRALSVRYGSVKIDLLAMEEAHGKSEIKGTEKEERS